MIKTKELYEELRENRDRIPNFNVHDLKAVLKHAKRERDGLFEKFQSKLNSISPDEWNAKTGDDWLDWYDKEAFPEWKKFLDGEYRFVWDPKLTYNGLNDDLIDFKFIVWLNENERFDFLQKPRFFGHAPGVAEYLRENPGEYLVTDEINLLYQELHTLIEFEAAFVEILELHIKKKLQTDKQKPALDNIIQLAIKRLMKNNKPKATEFMKLYYELKHNHPEYNPSDFVTEIDWPEPSENTQKDWMEKFDEAEKMLSNSKE